MKDNSYNGWTNYETWNYKLWMDQDGGDYWQSIASELLEQSDDSDTFTKAENASFTLADRLKDECEEYLETWMPDQSCVFADILNAGISQVNWYEIAGSLVEDCE